MRSKLHVVDEQTADRVYTEQDIVRMLKDRTRVCDIEKDTGWTRGRIRVVQDRLKAQAKIKTDESSPAAPAEPDPEPEPEAETPEVEEIPTVPAEAAPAPRGWSLSAILADVAEAAVRVGASLVLAAVGVWLLRDGVMIAFAFAKSLAPDPAVAEMLGELGVAIEILSATLPAVGGIFWDRGDRWLAGRVAVLWAPCLLFSIVAAVSYTSVNVGDGLKARGAVAQYSTELDEQLARAKDDLAHLDKCWKAEGPRRRECLWVLQLPSSKALSTSRAANADQVAKLADRVAALPHVAAADPGADNFSRAVQGIIKPEWIGIFRVLWLGIVTAFPGLLFNFARQLCRPAKEE
jgi:hypothetical protein